MDPGDLLRASLLDLLYEVRDDNLPIILGGGYGLILKRENAVQCGERLLIPYIPAARSTNDLDIFLRTEILADSMRAGRLRGALDRRGERRSISVLYY